MEKCIVCEKVEPWAVCGVITSPPRPVTKTRVQLKICADCFQLMGNFISERKLHKV